MKTKLALLVCLLFCLQSLAQDSLVDQALRLADQGNLPDAIELLEENLAQQPDNRDWQATTADLLIRADRLSDADALLSGPLSGHESY